MLQKQSQQMNNTLSRIQILCDKLSWEDEQTRLCVANFMTLRASLEEKS